MRVTKKRARGKKKGLKEGKEGAMVVRLERRKLAGSMGARPVPPLTPTNSFTLMASTDPLHSKLYSSGEPHSKPMKKKKKRHAHRGGTHTSRLPSVMYSTHTDPTKLAAVQHYSFLLGSLLDTEDLISDGMLCPH